MTKRLAIFITLAIGCGNNPGGGGSPDAQPPPVDAMGPPVLVCGDPDIDAPIVWSTSPHDREIGIDEKLPVTFDVADGCGIDMASIALKIGGTVVTPVITGDAKNLRVQYAPPAGFAQDAIIVAELVTTDTAGNTSTTPLTFRIWDDYTIYVRGVAGIDSTTPTTALGWREYYRVATTPSAGQRMLAQYVFAGATAEPALTFKTARMHACAKPVAATRTIEAYRLYSAFDSAATWINRTASAAWLAMGADAVGADREPMAFATLTFQPTVDGYWSVAESAEDISVAVQTWYEHPTQNFGVIFIGGANEVEINNGNCPLQIKGYLGRPLP